MKKDYLSLQNLLLFCYLVSNIFEKFSAYLIHNN